MSEPTTANPITLQQVLSVLPAKRDGKYECPVCGEWHLSIAEKNGKVLVKCWTGCEGVFERLVEKVKGLKPPTNNHSGPGLTVAQYAEAKQLPEDWLRDFFLLEDITFFNKPAVSSPYWCLELMKNDEEKLVLGARATSFKRRWGMGKDERAWAKGSKACLYGDLQIYFLHKHVAPAMRFCFIVEGESNTQTLHWVGLPALGVSGAGAWKSEYAKHWYLKTCEVIFVVQDPDEAGKKFVQDVADSFPAGRVFRVSLEELNAKDVSDLWISHAWLGEDEAREQVRTGLIEVNPVEVLPETGQVKQPRAKPEWSVETVTADTIQPKRIEWLWQDRIPSARLTLFYGLPGEGKSTVTIDVVARATTGRPFADRDNPKPPIDVLMMLAEDEASDTTVPRLMAAQADLSRVHFVQDAVLQQKDTRKERQLALDTDIALVERKLLDNPNIQLLVLDPISAYLGKVNRNKDSEVRPLLQRLKALALKTGVAVIAVSHFNKNSEQASIHRISGAGAWGEVPRALWAFIPAPEGDNGSDDHLMLSAKMNIAAKQQQQGLKYTFESTPLNIEGQETFVPRIKWLGAAENVSLDKVLQDKGQSTGKTDKAIAWLESFLSDGPKMSNDIKAACQEAGFKWRLIYSLKEKDLVNVRAYKVENPGPWWWELQREQA